MNDPASIYEKHLASIERIARFVARRARLNADDTDEFVQIVRVKLWENDYAIIRKFEERSSFTTYLTTVIGRLYFQWRTELLGKWRPSAEARRLGDLAITLERLITRDGFTFHEAVETLTTRAGAEVSIAQLEAIYVRLPFRNPRPVMVSGDVSPEAAAVESDADDRLEARDRERTARRTAEILDPILETFDPEDRLILKRRFWYAYKVPEIARELQLDQKKLYKRLDKLYVTLRHELESRGVSRADMEALLARGDQEIRLGVLSDEEIASLCPSKPRGGK